MQIDWTPIFTGFISLLMTVITCVLIPWIKAKLTSEQQAILKAVIRSGVYAAEQIFGTNGIGEEKKQFVLNYLEEKGINIDSQEVLVLLENCVKELKIELQ
jgi:hypothetical protein